MSTSKMIKGHEIFQSLNIEEVDALSKFAGSKDYDEAGIIYKQGAQGSHFFVILDGKVNLLLTSSDDQSTIVIGRLGKGDLLGLSPLLGSDRFMTTAQCSEKSSVLVVESAPFRRLLEKNPSVGLKVMSIISSAYFSRYVNTLRRIQVVLNEMTFQ